MEDTLRASQSKASSVRLMPVLILVLMEDTLRGRATSLMSLTYSRPNPCSNGRYSTRHTKRPAIIKKYAGPNPYSNGRYSTSDLRLDPRDELTAVLILILMEDTLREATSLMSLTYSRVLILILMEDILRDTDFNTKGRIHSVLILILMEDTLREILIAL